jgi:hypothetical protein
VIRRLAAFVVMVACGGQGSNGSCGVCILPKDSFGVIHDTPAGLCGLD